MMIMIDGIIVNEIEGETVAIVLEEEAVGIEHEEPFEKILIIDHFVQNMLSFDQLLALFDVFMFILYLISSNRNQIFLRSLIE